MMWPTVPLREVTRLDLNREPIDASKSYAMVGVLSFARGLFDREPIENGNTSYKHFLRLKSDHIVMSQLFGWEGALALSDDRFAGKYLSPQFPTFLSDEGRLDRKFLGWLMRRPSFWSDLGRRASGMGDRRRTLNPDAFFALEIPLPPLDEQRRIVSRIEEMAAKAEEARKTRTLSIKELTALRQANITACMESLDANARLGDVLTTAPRNGWSPSCDNLESGVPVLTLSAVTGWNFNSSAFKRTSMSTNPNAHYWVFDGDLLITRSNTPELVGHAAICNGSPSPAIYPDLMMKLPVDQRRASTRFVWYWLQSSRVRDFIQRSAKGTSPTMKKISQSIVQQIPFPAKITPSKQNEIVRQVEALQIKTDFVAALQEETATELDAMLPAILDKAFKGDL